MFPLKMCMSFLIVVLFSQQAQCQLVRKFGQLITSQFAKESAEATAKKGTQQAIRSAGMEAAEASAKSAARNGVEKAALNGAVNQSGKLIARFGDDAAEALGKVSPQNARRLSMLADELEATGKANDVMAIIAKGGRGDQVIEFLWRNKGTLVGSAVVATFVSNPDGFLDGTAKATSQVLEAVVEPVARETGRTFANWIGATFLLLTTAVAFYLWRTCNSKHLISVSNVN